MGDAAIVSEPHDESCAADLLGAVYFVDNADDNLTGEGLDPEAIAAVARFFDGLSLPATVAARCRRAWSTARDRTSPAATNRPNRRAR